MEPTVQLSHVSKRYLLGLSRTSLPTLVSNWYKNLKSNSPKKWGARNVFWALKDVSFELGSSQSLALVGPNGAGKTTILKLLANITQPTTGKIKVNGQLSALIELGAGFHPDLTGRENIYLNGILLGLKHDYIKQHFDEIVAFSELEQFIDTPIKRYSSGMKVRLGFAVAASIKPDIFLIDEVLSVGDSSFRQKCINRIEELINKGTSIIFVSHNMWLAKSICQTGIYLKSGEIQYYGEISEAINLYDRELNQQRAKNMELTQTGESIPSEAEITKIEIVSEGISNGDLNPEKPAEIRIHYLAYKEIDEAHAVVRILRSDGLTCIMLRTSLDKTQFSIKAGAGLISVLIDPLQLRGGTYYVQAMLRDSYDSHGIATGISDWFYVAGSILTFNEMNGVFEPNRKWSHQNYQQDTVHDYLR